MRTNGTSAMHYTLKDHQGSLTATVCGNAVERLSYDAWGRRRNPNGFGYNNVTTTFDRGYTGHEHMTAFGLINMNGRCYDPVTSSFLSVDRFVQSPDNSQGFNRYAYCMYNPLRYIDPSGWLPGKPSNSRPDDPPGLGNYHPGIYNPTDSESAWLVRLPDVDVIATSLGSNANTNTTITPYTEGTIWDNNHYLDKPKDTGPVLYETPIGHGGGGGGIGMGPNNHWGNSKLTSAIVPIQTAITVDGIVLANNISYYKKYPSEIKDLGAKIKPRLKTGDPLKKASTQKIGERAVGRMHIANKALGYTGIALSVIDIYASGEINISNGFYAGVAILCVAAPVGAGWIIGGVALTLDIAFYSYTGESFGDNLSHWFGDPSYKFRE